MKQEQFNQQNLQNNEQNIDENIRTLETSLLANPSMSRRAFFSGAAVVGTLTLLGTVFTSKGTMVSAYADEVGSVSFEVYVLSNREVPFYAFDSLNKKPIPGLEIALVIEMFEVSKAFLLKTDANGMAVWNMDRMQIDSSDAKSQKKNILIRINNTAIANLVTYKEGYRRITMPKLTLTCGGAATTDGRRSNLINLPTTPVKTMPDGTEELYLSMLLLDDEDINYAEQDVYVHPKNDALHTILAEVVTGEPNQKVSMGIMITDAAGKAVKNDILASGTTGTEKPYRATIIFEDYFLRDIPVGGMMTFFFASSEKYIFYYIPPLTYKLDKRPSLDGFLQFNASVGEQKNEGKKDSRSALNLDKFSWSIPKHDDLFVGLPGTPIEFFFDYNGRFGVTATVLSTSFVKMRNGENKAAFGETKSFRGMSGQAVFDQQYNDMQKAIKSFKDTRLSAKDKNKFFGKGAMTTTLDISFELAIIGLGTIAEEKNDKGDTDLVWTADVGLQAFFSIDASLTQPFTAGPVPMYIAFSFRLRITFQILVGMQFRNMFEDIDWHHHLPNGNGGPGIMIIVLIDIGAELGVGVRGVAAAGVFGHGFVREVLTFNYLKGKSYPRAQAYIGAGFGVFVQILFVKKKWTIKETPDQKIADSWEDKKSSTSEVQQARLSSNVNPNTLTSLSDFQEAESIPVTQDDLAACAEYRIPESKVQNSTTLSDVDAAAETSPYISVTPIPRMRLSEVSLLSSETETSVRNPYEEGYEYNVLDGLRPTRQEVRRSDVYSNMRIQAIEPHVPFNVWDASKGDKPPLIIGRIGTVMSGDTALTRLIINVWNSNDKKFNPDVIIDFDGHGKETALLSSQRLDVDFSIDTFIDVPHTDKTTEGWLRQYALISIVSIPIVKQNLTLEEQMASQFITTILFDITDYMKGSYEENYQYMSPACYVIRPDGYAVCNPHVLIHAHPELHEGSSMGMRTYAASLSVVYSKINNQTGEGSIGITTFVFDLYENYQPMLLDRVFDKTLDIKAPVSKKDLAMGAFAVHAGPSCFPTQIDGKYWSNVLIAWRGKDSARDEGADGKSANDQNTSTSFVSSVLLTYEDEQFEQRNAGVLTLPGVSSLTVREYGQADYPFMFTDETVEGNIKPLMLVAIDQETRVPQTLSGVGMTSIINYFSSEDGEKLYAVRVIDGDSEVIDQDKRIQSKGLYEEERNFIVEGAKLFSNAYSDAEGYDTNGYQKSTESVYVKRFQVFETRYVKSLHAYYNFYPVAQLDFCPHSIVCCPQTSPEKNNSEADRSFLFSTISDYDKSKAELRRVSIPRKIALHVSSAVGETKFAAVGDSVWYELTVTNVGNEPITGFSTEIYACEKDSDQWKLIETKRFDHLKQYLTDSHDNCRFVYDDDGHVIPSAGGCYETEIQRDVFDVVGILWPGCTRTYRLNFTMTEGLQGLTKFSVKAVKGTSNFDDLSVDEDKGKGTTTSSLSSLSSVDSASVLAAGAGDTDETDDEVEKYLAALAAFSSDDFVGEIDDDSDLRADFSGTPYVEIHDTESLKENNENVPRDQIESYDNFGDGVYKVRRKDAEEQSGNEALGKTGDANGGLLAAAAGLAATAAIGVGVAMKNKPLSADTEAESDE